MAAFALSGTAVGEESELKLLPGPLRCSHSGRAAEPLQNASLCLRLALAAQAPQRGVAEGTPKLALRCLWDVVLLSFSFAWQPFAVPF